MLVPHVRQSYNWDCGLACVEMVLRALDVPCTAAHLREQASTRSVWTIDLAFLLESYGVATRYYTSQIGCNPEYETLGFYSARLRDDRARVEQLFNQAASAGSPRVEQAMLSRAELHAALLAGHTLAIVLLDRLLLPAPGTGAERNASAPAPPSPAPAASSAFVARQLFSSTLQALVPPPLRARKPAEAANDEGHEDVWVDAPDDIAHIESGADAGGMGCADGDARAHGGAHVGVDGTSGRPAVSNGGSGASRRGYQGHYVLVVGLSAARDAYRVLDPASGPSLLSVPCEQLEAAWHTFGTDDDVLLVSDARLGAARLSG